MQRKLNNTETYYCTTENEAQALIEEIKEDSTGDVTVQTISRKEHKGFGEYFETTIKTVYTTSKSILERGV